MADNYLEKRYAEINSGGKTVLRRSTPSLDTLLRRRMADTEYAGDYITKQLQLERIAGAATPCPPGTRYVTDAAVRHLGADAFIVVDGSAGDTLALGMALERMFLKAEEMGLHGTLVPSSAPAAAAIGAIGTDIIIAIGKASS